MKGFLAELRPAILATLVLAVVCSGLYPLVVFGIAQRRSLGVGVDMPPISIVLEGCQC